ncbi:MAG: hypothetical protein NC548_06320 [Lachnospiraceae bacterium]|nr:hypothetical protein [Lachnospiraceae bacterium]
MLFATIYVGYFIQWGHSYVMCISDNLDIVRGYLIKVRGLHKHEIEIDEVTLDEVTMIALYEDYVIEEYIDGVYLTRRDISALDAEIKDQLQDFVNMYHSLTYYRAIIGSIGGKISKDISDLDRAIDTIEKRLTSAKSLRKIQQQIMLTSDVFSKNISTYLGKMGSVEEAREMRGLFLQKLEDPMA